MKIKNCIHFLLAILLLISGSTPVLAQTPDQCGSVEPIRPDDRVTDAVSDVPAPHIDITAVETSLTGERLTVVFHLRDLPDTLRFNRTEYGKGVKEYEWEVAIDVDNDRSTGPGGFDMLLSAYHIAFLSHTVADPEKGTPIEDLLEADLSAPIEDMLESSVWEISPDGSTTTTTETHFSDTHSDGSISAIRANVPAVSAESDTITITGVVPGITSASRLAFEAYDVQFAGGADQIACHDSYRKSVTSWVCDWGAVLIRPGQTATDEVSDVSAAYLDIVEVNSFLSGETLTVSFRFRDIPETLTFNRAGTPTNLMEYSWGVSIDVDNDRRTGDGGFDYFLSAHHIVWPPHAGDNTEASIEKVAKADVWEMKPGGSIEGLRDASLEVSAETDMMILSGRVPGITPDSRLSFTTFKHLGESDELGCQEPPVILKSSSRSADADGPHALVGHIDIRGVMTAVEGETLTVTLQLRDIPETLTFARTGVPEDALEYSWEVSVDVDADSKTGNGGYDYMLSAAYFVPRFAQGSNTAAEITQPGFVRASLWGLDRKGYRVLAEADIDVEVSAAGNTITLSGEIPGITEASPLKFRAYDFFAGSVEMSSLGPSITGSAADNTPESLAPIPVTEPVVIPPRYAQHLNSLKYLDGVPAILINHQGDPVTALDVDQMKSDRWLQLWAMSAMEDDGVLDLAHSIAETQTTGIAMSAHHIAVIYMNAFAAAEQHCAENREELEVLIQMYANQASDLPNIQYPYLTVVHELATRLTQMDETQNVGSCTDHLASLPDFPTVRTFCFGGNANEQVMGQKAMAKQIAVQREELTDPTAPRSLLVSAANLNCWPETHE
ncbi:MAG: hypothetical protein OXO50_13835 [Caldilineaceae bacterium]|nr:hypothetical protein [Caldilineaceae bacterium]MDE0196690.1 hypothetical protein [Caldilineaceae bacterium]